MSLTIKYDTHKEMEMFIASILGSLLPPRGAEKAKVEYETVVQPKRCAKKQDKKENIPIKKRKHEIQLPPNERHLC